MNEDPSREAPRLPSQNIGKNNKQMRDFIEMCFNPKTETNAKLKEMLIHLSCFEQKSKELNPIVWEKSNFQLTKNVIDVIIK